MVASAPGPDGVAGLPVGAVLRAAGGELGLVELGWGHGELPSCAPCPVRAQCTTAKRAGRGVELDDDRVGAVHGLHDELVLPRQAVLKRFDGPMPGG